MNRRPSTILKWLQTPFQSAGYILWRRYRYKFLIILVLLLLGLLIFNFIYSAPVSENNGDKDEALVALGIASWCLFSPELFGYELDQT